MLHWESYLGFLELRMTEGIETIEDRQYIRTVEIEGNQGWFSVSFIKNKPSLRIEVSVSLISSIRSLMAKIKRMFDLRANTVEIELHLASVPIKHPGLRIPGSFNGFETTVRAILGQQITVKAASTLSSRFAAKFGKNIETPYKELTHIYPDPASISSLTVSDIAKLGIISSRALSIIALANAVCDKKISFSAGTDVVACLFQPTLKFRLVNWAAA